MISRPLGEMCLDSTLVGTLLVRFTLVQGRFLFYKGICMYVL